MGLSSWIQNALARSRAKSKRARTPREDFVQLFLTRLEDRRVLNAAFQAPTGGNGTLTLEGFTAGASLSVQDTGTQYQFVLSGGETWTGANGDGVTASGNTLSVDKAEIATPTDPLNPLNQIQIDGSAINPAISFEGGTVDFTGLSGGLDIIGAGAISQDVGSNLIVSSFDASATSLTLGEAANNFGSVSLNVGSDATLEDTDGVMLGSITTLTGNFNLTAGGAVSEAATPGTIKTGGNLTISANGDIGAAGAGALDVEVGGTAGLTATGSDIYLSSDQNLVINHLETAATQDTVQISTTGTANLTLQVVTANYVQLETDNVSLSTEDGQLAIQGDTLSAGSITLANTGTAGSTSLNANLQTDGGDIDLQNAAQVTLAGSITIDTELGNDSDAGNVLFSTATGAEINATTSGVEGLMIDATSTGGTDGNISLSDIGTTTRLGTLSVMAKTGTITLNDTAGTAGVAEVLTDNGSVTFGSFTQLTANTSINTMGGDVNWQDTTVFSGPGGPYNLTIDTTTTGPAAGNVQLGRFTNTDGTVAGTFVNNLQVDTTNGTAAGTLMLHGDITLANSFLYNGGTATFLNAANSTLGVNSSIATQGTGTVQVLATSGITSNLVMQTGTAINTTNGNVTLQAANNVQLSRVVAGGTNTASITAGGSITDADTTSDGAGQENIVANMVRLQAATGIGDGTLGDLADIDINAGTLAAVTNTGDINLEETDTLIIGSVGGLSGLNLATGTAGDDITVSANGNLFINADVTAIAPSNITLSGQNITLNSARVEITGDGTIATTDPRNGPVTGTGIITIIASAATTLNANSTIRTGGGVIQFTTDDIIINTATALIDANQANGGVVMIRNFSAGRNIELGGSVGGAVLDLSNAELQRITADSLRIGFRDLDTTNDAGNINFTATFSAATAALPKVQLFAGGNVTQNAGAGFIAGNIGIDVDGSVMLGDAANDAVNTLSVLAGGSVLFNDANSLTVGGISDRVDSALPADGEAGIAGVRAASFVDLRAQSGDLTVLDIAGAATEISAGGLNPTNNLAINLLAAAADTSININAGANVTSTAERIATPPTTWQSTARLPPRETRSICETPTRTWRLIWVPPPMPPPARWNSPMPNSTTSPPTCWPLDATRATLPATSPSQMQSAPRTPARCISSRRAR